MLRIKSPNVHVALVADFIVSSSLTLEL